MMDPVSIVGIIGSVVGIADVVTRSIQRLSTLKTKFRDVPFLISTLTGQLCTVQAALDQLSGWAKRDLTIDARYRKLATQVGDALDCFDPLIKALESRLDRIEGIGEGQVDLSKRVSFLWSERELVDYLLLLDRQVNALTLLLQALQCKTFLEQEKIMTESDGRTILRLARDCTSSVRGFDDTSRYDNASLLSEETNALSLYFDFDSILMSSNIYQAAQRSHLKQLVRSKGKQSEDRQTPIHALHVPQHLDSKLRGSNSKERRLWGLRPLLGIKRPNTRDLEGERRNSEVEEFLRKERAYEHSRRRILFTGAGNSGKSTLMKGFRVMKSGDLSAFSPEEQMKWKIIIRDNIVNEFIHTMIMMDKLCIPLENETNEPHAEKLSTMYAFQEEFPFHVVQAIEALWADLGVQHYHRQRGSDFYPEHNISYWVNEMRRVAAKEYEPSLEDILKARLRTNYIDSTRLELDGTPYEFFDVGGARSARKKWIHVMNDKDLVFFLVNATGYDKCLVEDMNGNHLDESYMLFESLVKSKYFESSPFVIVFTHKDQLDEELRHYSPNGYGFPDLPLKDDGLCTEYEYMKYLEARFMQIAPESKRPHIRMVWANLADPNAVDMQRIYRVMRELLDLTIRDPERLLVSIPQAPLSYDML